MLVQKQQASRHSIKSFATVEDTVHEKGETGERILAIKPRPQPRNGLETQRHLVGDEIVSFSKRASQLERHDACRNACRAVTKLVARTQKQ